MVDELIEILAKVWGVCFVIAGTAPFLGWILYLMIGETGAWAFGISWVIMWAAIGFSGANIADNSKY